MKKLIVIVFGLLSINDLYGSHAHVCFFDPVYLAEQQPFNVSQVVRASLNKMKRLPSPQESNIFTVDVQIKGEWVDIPQAEGMKLIQRQNELAEAQKRMNLRYYIPQREQQALQALQEALAARDRVITQLTAATARANAAPLMLRGQ